ncbi:ATP-binding protein [Streptomyces sp. NPDC002838]|uniref:sensor histidine kinase n=1 Tax=Streptomyces sp. NPDC002838 TaxID=3154436 RepID=UPI003321F7AF
MPTDIDLSAYRIVQEALTNVVRHADTGRCRVAISHGDEELSVEVVDDGRGATANGSAHGFGLVGMRERVGRLHGHLSAGPRPEGGFRMAARLPLPKLAVMTDTQGAPDWYRGFRRWEPRKPGKDVISMRALLAEMIGAGVVVADSDEAEWMGGGGHPAWDVRGDETLVDVKYAWRHKDGVLGIPPPRRRRQGSTSTSRAKCTRSPWWCSPTSSPSTSTCLMGPLP